MLIGLVFGTEKCAAMGGRLGRLVGASVTAVALTVTAACAPATAPQRDDLSTVAGMAVTDGPSGLRSDAPKPTRTAAGTDGGAVDYLATQSVSDVEDYWKQAYGDALRGDFKAARQLVSWDSRRSRGSFCEQPTADLVNAAFCPLDASIGWDRGVLLPSLKQTYGEMAAVMVLAHEYGHAIQYQAGLNRADTPTLVAEQQADCFAGAYMRWVAEGDSPRFELSTGDGLNTLLASMIAIRDPLFRGKKADGDEHGSAFERVSAFQFGFRDGPAACTKINAKEITQRRGDLPVELLCNQAGDWPVSRESVKAVVSAMNQLFRPDKPPALSFNAAAAGACPDAKPTPPVSFCPATNSVIVNLPALKTFGAPSTGPAGLTGDNTAYSALISRYLLALQAARGLPIEGVQAGLRTACLTGVATAKLARQVTTPDGNTVALAAGDLDEAVAGLLTNGLVASDVNGQTVPTGFARIEAFRAGVLGDTGECFTTFA